LILSKLQGFQKVNCLIVSVILFQIFAVH